MRFPRLLAISALVLAVHGYHFGIEDEAIYLPAVKLHLNPALYPFDAFFFTPQAKFTLFDEFMAILCRLTRLPLDWTFFAVYCLSTFLFVLALWQLAKRFFRDEGERWAAVLLPSALLTLPVAGTALFIMDQHLHPRNLATTALLFALVAVLDKRRILAFAFVALAAMFHPLEAVFGVSLVSMFAWRTLRLHFLAFALLLPIAWFVLPPGSVDWRHAGVPYLFLPEWAWYEWLGILGPLAGLLGCGWWAAARDLPRMASTSRTLTWFGVFYFLVTAVITFVPRFAQLAPLQPMRTLQLIYIFLLLFAGGIAWQTFHNRRALLLILVSLICGGMYYAQRREFSASRHIEWPGAIPDNPWLQAFDWIRRNTPPRAYFVMDPRYMESPGEDFHGFRALAERSLLVDDIKDQAVATVYPALALEWRRRVEVLRNWRTFDRADLLGLKQRFGVDWVLLERDSPPEVEGLDCPYQNQQLRVCRIG